MTSCSSFAMTTEIMSARVREFAKLQPEAIKQLKGLGMSVTSENILEFQEALALEKRITPPHWSGWVKCIRCGQMPAQQGIYGDEVTACSFCLPFGEAANFQVALQPEMIAHCNKVDFYLRNMKAKELPETYEPNAVTRREILTEEILELLFGEKEDEQASKNN